MSWDLLDPETRRTAERVCTFAELEALRAREELRRRGEPDGYRSVAQVLGVGVTTARDRLLAAERKLSQALTGGAR